MPVAGPSGDGGQTMDRDALVKTGVSVTAIGLVVGAIVVGTCTAGRSAAQSLHRHAVAAEHHAGSAASRHPTDAAEGDAGLPVSLDPTALAAFVACLLALTGWAVWQASHRCRDLRLLPGLVPLRRPCTQTRRVNLSHQTARKEQDMAATEDLKPGTVIIVYATGGRRRAGEILDVIGEPGHRRLPDALGRRPRVDLLPRSGCDHRAARAGRRGRTSEHP